jgi:hypothetical protein
MVAWEWCVLFEYPGHRVPTNVTEVKTWSHSLQLDSIFELVAPPPVVPFLTT